MRSIEYVIEYIQDVPEKLGYRKDDSCNAINMFLAANKGLKELREKITFSQ